MTLFESILKECNLLTEAANAVTDEKIKDAIENCKIVSLVYNEDANKPEDDKTPNHRLGKSWRYIYPMIYGQQVGDRKTGGGIGNWAIWAYQDGGSTSEEHRSGTNKGEKQGWKLFRLDRIVAWYVQENTENDQTHTFNPEDIPDFKENKSKNITYFSTIKYVCPALSVKPTDDDGYKTKDDINGEPSEENQNKSFEVSLNTDYVNQYKEKENGITLDNNGNLNYNSNIGKQNNVTTPENSQDSGDKIMAPATEPVAKSDIEDVQVQQTNAEEPEQKVTADDKPITKDNVNGEDEENKPENDVTSIYESYMNRWENLYR